MAKAKADRDQTVDWVDMVRKQDELNNQDIEDRKSDNNDSIPITDFILQKQKEIKDINIHDIQEDTPFNELKEDIINDIQEDTPSNDVQEVTLSQEVKEERLSQEVQEDTPSQEVQEDTPSQEVQEKKYNLEDLEEEGYNIYYNLDEFCGADFILDKRYVAVNFFKVDGKLVLSHIVSYEYEEDDSDKISFSNFKATMSQVNGLDNLHYSIQTYKNLTLDTNIELVASLKQKATDEDPTLSAIILSKNKKALQDAKKIIADENSGIEHIDLPEEDEKTSISNKIKPKTKK